MNIAVIGGSGFIGSRLAAILEKNEQSFSILDKQTSESFPDRCIQVDIRDREKLTGVLAGFDAVVNLAAEHRDDVNPPSLYDDVNVQGSQNICDAAASNGINRIVFTSSVAVYGHAPGYSNEDAECRPFNEYGRTKLLAEKVYQDWAGADSTRMLSIVRPTVVFGEDNRGNVYNLFKQIASGKFLFVGSGRNHKAMAYVGNVAAFLHHVIEQSHCGTWNYVDQPIPDMLELVSTVRRTLGKGEGTGIRLPAAAGLLGGMLFDILSKITGKRFPVSRIRIRKFMSDSSFSAARALETGFIPPFSMEESLPRVLAYEFPTKGA